MITDFLRYFLLPETPVTIDEVVVDAPPQDPEPPFREDLAHTHTVQHIVLVMNYCMMFAFLLTLAVMLFLWVRDGELEVPGVISNVFSLSVGYIINSVTTFLKISEGARRR